MELVKLMSENHVTFTLVCEPLTVVSKEVKLKLAVVPPGDDEHKVALAVFAFGVTTGIY